MSERECVPEKEDYQDMGPMPSYDYEAKPVCLHCESQVWVVAVGRNHKWNWKCTNCQRELK